MEMNWFEDDETKPIDVPEFDKLCSELRAQNDKVKAMEAEVKEEKSIREKMKKKLLRYMEEFGKQKYVGDFGTVYIKNNFSVKTPKTEEEKLALFNWMNEKGIFEKYATVNSMSLNSLYRSLLESEGPDFKMPGVEDPTHYATLEIRSK